MDTTDAFYQEIRASIGPDALLQLNHPWGSSGMLGLADYDVASGTVGRPSHFSERFDAMEVLNDKQYDDFLPLYLDLVNRGYEPTPTGVSDAHGYRNGQGVSLTWLDAGVEEPGALTNERLIERMRARRVVVGRGPYVEVTAAGQWAPGQTLTGTQTLRVDVHAASFVKVDTIDLLRDGAVIESIPWAGEAVEVSLPTDADAAYVVIAHGTEEMAPVYPGVTPWAMAAAVRLDVAGDGWDPPLPPLIIGN